MKTSDLKKHIINCSVVALFAALGFTFASLCATQFTVGFFYEHSLLFALLLQFLVFTATALCFIFYFTKKETAYKLTISVFLLLDFVLILFYSLLATGFLYIVKDAESFELYLQSAGAWMDILFIVLQYLQVVILPSPSFVTLVAGTALFGAVKCFIYSFISIVLGSLTAFFIGRFLGYRAVSWMVGKETLDKWLKKIKGKDYVILTAMFVLPFFPDDVLCFVAGLSTMSTPYFVIMILISRAIAVATTCFSFSFIPFNTWWGILSWILILAAVVTLFILFYKNQEKIQTWFAEQKKKFKRDKKR